MASEETPLANTQISYDRVASVYAEHIGDELAGKPLDRALLSSLAEEVGTRGPIADVGCGPGHVARYLHERGASVIGIDLSPDMIAVAQRLHPGLHFQQGSMLSLAAADETWGGIVAFYSIIHLPPSARPQALAEFFRVLRPGGLLLLAFHIGDECRHLDEWWNLPVALDFYYLQPEEVKAQLKAAGFIVTAMLVRKPYASSVEHQSDRAYLLVSKPTIPL
jgi:SAM-dependent methyltransferase